MQEPKHKSYGWLLVNIAAVIILAAVGWHVSKPRTCRCGGRITCVNNEKMLGIAFRGFGIDIGGSALKGAPVNVRTGELLAERFKVETPTVLTPTEMAAAVKEIVHHFKWRGRVGVGFPSVVQGSFTLTSSNR